MNTKSLINNAVLNTSTTGIKGFADRLFARWFNRLVYAQIWEDPKVDIDALSLKPGARMLTISSGGCNALAYLTTQPSVVHVVDLNDTHLAMLDLKRSALAHLPSYNDVLDFLGEANKPENSQRYQQYIAKNLSEKSLRYWETKDWRGRPRYTYFTRHAYRHGLLGQFIGLSHHLVRLLGGNMGRIASAKSMEEQTSVFNRELAPVFKHWLVRWLCNQPIMLYSLGIPPAQFSALKHDADTQGITMAELFQARMRHLACDFPLTENCFAGQAFARRYDTSHDSALPMYLQREHYDTIREHLYKLHSHHATMTEVLRGLPSGSMDAYLLLDAQDWMDTEQISELWQEITRTASHGARVVFRTGGSQSPLEEKLPAELLANWHTNSALNNAFHQQDRSAIYGGTHLYVRH